jgi:hypothetical protein
MQRGAPTHVKPGSGRTFYSKYTTPEWSFASALRSSVEWKQRSENQKESAGPQKKQVANKASGQFVQKEIVNSNAIDHARYLHYGSAGNYRARSKNRCGPFLGDI